MFLFDDVIVIDMVFGKLGDMFTMNRSMSRDVWYYYHDKCCGFNQVSACPSLHKMGCFPIFSHLAHHKHTKSSAMFRFSKVCKCLRFPCASIVIVNPAGAPYCLHTLIVCTFTHYKTKISSISNGIYQYRHIFHKQYKVCMFIIVP